MHDTWVESNRQLERIKDVETLLRIINRKAANQSSALESFEKIIDNPRFGDILLDGDLAKMRYKIKVSRPKNIYGEPN